MIVLVRICFLQFPERFMILAQRVVTDTVLNTLKIAVRFFFQNIPQGLFCLFILLLRQQSSPQKRLHFHLVRMTGKHISADFLHLLVISFIFTVERLSKLLADHEGNLCRIFIYSL